MTKVVIVGGGFAGVKAARILGDDNRFDVTLISSRLCFEYHAALYRSATGRSPLEVAVPLKEIFRDGQGVQLEHDTITAIDPGRKVVTGESGTKYKYEKLILALGTVTAYFGIEGLPEYSYGIKSMDEAMKLKDHLHSELTAGHKPDLNYVVVGAGPSGVELAAEMVSYLKAIRRHHGIRKQFHVDLVEAAPRILPTLPEAFSRRVEKRLKRLGIKIYTSTAVKGETADKLQLPEGTIETHTVVWTAGMTGSPVFGKHAQFFEIAKGNRVTVDRQLQARPDIWVAGDSAATERTGWAQTAIYDGNFIAQNLKRAASGQKPLEYKPAAPIGAIPAGPGWCAVNFPGRQVYGYWGWLVRRWMDMQLFHKLLPPRLALRSWLMGNRVEESCPTCSGGQA